MAKNTLRGLYLKQTTQRQMMLKSTPEHGAKQNEINAYQITIHGSLPPAANKYMHPFQGQSPNPHTPCVPASLRSFGIKPTNGRRRERNASDKRTLISGWIQLKTRQWGGTSFSHILSVDRILNLSISIVFL